MLVLTRYKGECLMIGDDVEVRIINTINGEVSIGIEAPRDIEVHREEIYHKIKAKMKSHQD